MSEKTYLGDGCYATFDGHGVILTTENGIETTNTVYLEPQVYGALVQFRDRVTGKKTGFTIPLTPEMGANAAGQGFAHMGTPAVVTCDGIKGSSPTGSVAK